MDRVPSLAVGGEWTMVEEFDLPALLKLVANPPPAEDLVWAGHLDQYDDAYDKVTTRTAKPLKRIENKVFYAVRTADDPILEKFAVEEIGNVYATDAILALLMASPRYVHIYLMYQISDGAWSNFTRF
jgi:translation initiation factor 3 subunit D